MKCYSLKPIDVIVCNSYDCIEKKIFDIILQLKDMNLTIKLSMDSESIKVYDTQYNLVGVIDLTLSETYYHTVGYSTEADEYYLNAYSAKEFNKLFKEIKDN